MEFFLVAGPNVSLEKTVLFPVISTGLSLEDTGLFLDRSGEKLDLGILPSRSPRTSALSGASFLETPH